MPYGIFNVDGQHCVYKTDGGQRTGKALGCHETRKAAGRQIAAIEANEDTKMFIPQQFSTPLLKSVYVAAYKTAMEQLAGTKQAGQRAKQLATMATMAYNDENSDTDSQKGTVFLNPASYVGWKVPPEAVNYDPYGGVANSQGCATCFWFVTPNECRVVAEQVVPTGRSDFYLDEEKMRREISRAMQVVDDDDDTSDVNDKKITENNSDSEHIFKQIKRWLLGENTFAGFKVIDTESRGEVWIARYTNPYRDRDNEHFSEKAIKEDIEYMRKTGDYPQLWFGHIPGTKHGQAVWVGMIGRFAFAAGTFDDTPLAEAFKAYYKRADDLHLSHGFLYDSRKRKDGVYQAYHTYEISTLPEDWASNPHTSFIVNLGDKAMSLNEDTLAALKQAIPDLDDTLLQQIVQDTQTHQEKLEAAGVSRKNKAQADKAEDMEDNEDDDENEEKDDKAQTPATNAALSQTLNTLAQAIEANTKAVTQLIAERDADQKAQGEKKAPSPDELKHQLTLEKATRIIKDAQAQQDQSPGEMTVGQLLGQKAMQTILPKGEGE